MILHNMTNVNNIYNICPCHSFLLSADSVLHAHMHAHMHTCIHARTHTIAKAASIGWLVFVALNIANKCSNSDKCAPWICSC